MTTTGPRPIQEYSDLEYLKLCDMRDLLEQSLNDDENRDWLVAVLDELLEIDCNKLDEEVVRTMIEEPTFERPAEAHLNST